MVTAREEPDTCSVDRVAIEFVSTWYNFLVYFEPRKENGGA
jgi:hypothetical protein